MLSLTSRNVKSADFSKENRPGFVLNPHTMPRPLIPWLIALCLLAGESMASIRVGIWSADKTSADLAALLTAGLGKEPGVQILERDELAKIFAEKKLQSWLAEGEGVPNVTGADALLILTAAGGKALRVRFVACAPGVVLADFLLPPDSTAETDVVIARLRRHLARLSAPPEKSLAFSVLNLHSALGESRWRDVETRLTALLESRLAAESGVFVLDRRTLDSLQMEKHWNADMSPFRRGVWLIEGSIEPVNPGRPELRVVVRAERRDPPSKIEVSASGPAGQLEKLAGTLGSDLLKKTGAATSDSGWHPLAEAEEFAKESVWARKNQQPERALEAVRSARALGADSADLSALLVILLAEKLGSWNYDTDDNEPRKLPEAVLKERLAIAREMLAELDRQPPSQAPFVPSGDARGLATGAALKVLRQAVETNGPGAAEDLRGKLRVLTGFDPAQGRFSTLWPVVYGFAQYLANDTNEYLAHQKGFLTSSDPALRFRASGVLRAMRFKQAGVISPHLEPDPARAQAIFGEFVEWLAANPDTVPFELYVRSGEPADLAGHAKLARKFVEQVAAHADEYWSSGWFPYLVELATRFDSSDESELKEPLTRLMLFYLKRADWHDEETFSKLWKPKLFEAESAAEIWEGFLIYKERTLSAARGESDQAQRTLVSNFKYCAERFAEQFPSPPSAPAGAVATVKVTRYWRAPLENGKVIQFNYVRASGKHVAVPCGGPDRYAFYLVSVPSLEGRLIESPVTMIDFVFTRDAVYPMSYEGERGETAPLARFDLTAGTWTVQDAPAIHHQHNMALGDTLYLKAYTPGNIRLMRYDWRKKSAVLLASNRRKPPQNQFDDCEDYFASSHYFPGPGGAPCVLIGGQPFRIREEPGDWQPLFPVVEDAGKFPTFSGKFFWRLVSNGPRPMLLSRRGDLVLIDPDKPDPIPLALSERTAGLFPKWAEKVPVKPFSTTDVVEFNEVFMVANGQGVFSIHRKSPEEGGYFYLRWLRPGRGETLVRLNFSDAPPLPPGAGGIPNAGINGNSVFARPQMHICDEGLIFATMQQGFWFVPFADLKSAVKSDSASR
jgi:hypothetical protein